MLGGDFIDGEKDFVDGDASSARPVVGGFLCASTDEAHVEVELPGSDNDDDEAAAAAAAAEQAMGAMAEAEAEMHYRNVRGLGPMAEGGTEAEAEAEAEMRYRDALYETTGRPKASSRPYRNLWVALCAEPRAARMMMSTFRPWQS